MCFAAARKVAVAATVDLEATPAHTEDSRHNLVAEAKV